MILLDASQSMATAPRATAAAETLMKVAPELELSVLPEPQPEAYWLF